MDTQVLWAKAKRRIRRSSIQTAKGAVQSWRGLTQGTRPELHAFVVGAQRSGTNMVMNVLDRSFDTTVYHERDERAFDNYLMREPDLIQELVHRARAPVFIIKALCEMHQLPWLMERFAPAKVIWVVRHYDDAVNSSLRSFTTVADQVSRIAEDPDAHRWMGKGMSEDTHARLKQLHHAGINAPSRLALFWYTRNRLLFDTGLAQDDRVKLVSYERLVTEPAQAFGELFGFLGLEYRDAIGRHVTPRSIRKADKPDIDASVRATCDELYETLIRIAENGAAVRHPDDAVRSQ